LTIRLYVARLRPKGAELAKVNLKRQGFQYLEPKKILRSVNRGKVSEVKVNVFPSYLLVWFDRIEDPWHLVNETFGIMALIQNHMGPKPIREDAAEFLQAEYGAGPVVEDQPEAFTFRKDHRVRVTIGSWAGHEGVVKWAKDDRVRWLMSVMGAEREVTSPASMLELVV